MTAKDRPTLKALFETGDVPDGPDYADLVDSYVVLNGSTVQTVASPIIFSAAIGTTEVSAQRVSASTITALATVHAADVQTSNVSAAAAVFAVVSASSFVQKGSDFLGLVARLTCLPSNSAGGPVTFNLPSGANIITFTVDVEEPFATDAGATAIAVNISAAVAVGEIRVSASGQYGNADAVSRLKGLRNVTSTVEAWVSVQNTGSALTAGQAIFSVVYV